MDLDVRRVLAARPSAPVEEELAQLWTPWGARLRDAVASDAKAARTVLAAHPRPELARERVTMLHGWWEYAIVPSADGGDQGADGGADPLTAVRAAEPPAAFDGRILVPFSPEAALSGVGRQLRPDQLLWYRRRFEAPSLAAGERCLLHLDGVDWACSVRVNGRVAGEHVGAYLPFELDITDLLLPGENLVELCVADPSETGAQLRGKQRLARGSMWYTAQSGMWQPVWLELVPAAHVTSLAVDADPATGVLRVRAQVTGPAAGGLRVELLDADGARMAVARSEDDGLSATARLASAHPWSPDDPYLYRLRVSYGDDLLTSYCAFRSVAVAGAAGDGAGGRATPRICLNGRPIFLRGLLYQGYWPDGLLTAPSDEALVSDLVAARDHGFNLLRVHAKVESSRFYWHCDRLGLLVAQDVPQGGAPPRVWPSANLPTLVRRSWCALDDRRPSVQRLLGGDDPAYQREWRTTCLGIARRLALHPSVILWVLFNESWGQFDARGATDAMRATDASRPILSVSGWYDQGAGDVCGVHNYFRSQRVYKDAAGRREHGSRAFLVSEFGGLTWRVEGHSSLERTYGYGDFDSLAQWRSSLIALLARTEALERDGLSGFVYTQLTDVEEETNGILTYDRRVDKLA